MRLTPFFLCLPLALLPGCRKNPNSVTDQTAVLRESSSAADRSRAVENLRRIGGKEAAAGLAKGLIGASPRMKIEIAQALAEFKEPAAAPALAQALDPSATERGGEVNSANQKITRILGDLGNPSVAPALIRFARESPDDRVKLEAVNALGKLRDPSAVPVLAELATDETQELSVNSRSLQALAAINAPEALPAYFKMLFADRKGTSFYFDAWYGISRLREASFDRALQLLNGKDRECLDIASKHGLTPPAVLAKAAELEGDLQDPRAIPVLEKLLKFTWRDKSHEEVQSAMTRLVRQSAAEALGRMRANAAVGALTAALATDEVRDAYVTALARIGDKGALPNLVACAGKGNWGQRDACLQGLALLGGAAEAKQFDRLLKEERGRVLKECKDAGNKAADCAKGAEKELESRARKMNSYRAVELLARCSDATCLESGLRAPDPVARQRAAYQLAHRGAVDSVPALLSAVLQPLKADADAQPRIAAVLASEWLVERDASARTRIQGELPALRSLIEEESASPVGRNSVEELRRLVDLLGRGRTSPAAPAAAPPEPAKVAAPPPVKATSTKVAGARKKGKLPAKKNHL